MFVEERIERLEKDLRDLGAAFNTLKTLMEVQLGGASALLRSYSSFVKQPEAKEDENGTK